MSKLNLESLLAMLGDEKEAEPMKEAGGTDVAMLISQLFGKGKPSDDMEEEDEDEEDEGLDLEDLLAKLLAGKLKGDG